jgi:hypothetical protein
MNARHLSFVQRTLGVLVASAFFAACSSGGAGTLMNGLGGADGGAASNTDAGRVGSGASGGDDDEADSDGTARDAGAKKKDAGSTRDGGSTADAGRKDSGGGGETCAFAGTCDSGLTMQLCTTTNASGSCTGARYDIDGTSYACASCTSCTAAADDAMNDCHPDIGGFDAGGSTPVETCSVVGTTCATGTLQYCYTSTSMGCTSRYVHDGNSYPCAQCASCDSAWGAAYVSCMDAAYGCDDLESCCGSFPSQSQSGCYSAVSSYRAQPGGDVSCKQTYDSYRSAGNCP